MLVIPGKPVVALVSALNQTNTKKLRTLKILVNTACVDHVLIMSLNIIIKHDHDARQIEFLIRIFSLSKPAFVDHAACRIYKQNCHKYENTK